MSTAKLGLFHNRCALFVVFTKGVVFWFQYDLKMVWFAIQNFYLDQSKQFSGPQISQGEAKCKHFILIHTIMVSIHIEPKIFTLNVCVVKRSRFEKSVINFLPRGQRYVGVLLGA